MQEIDLRTLIAGESPRGSGKSLRRRAPRSSHGDWRPADNRPGPLDLLQAQDQDRLQPLVPIKYGRMLASPFAFLRGSAVVMAADLADSPTTGLQAVLCGDAHLSNFGLFASPERQLVFDVNDFDETYPGPWEWDLKRLAASIIVAGRENGYSDKQNRALVHNLVRIYAQTMGKFAEMHFLDVWYHYVPVGSMLPVLDRVSKPGKKGARKLMKKAARKTHAQTLKKLTRNEAGQRQIISDPPLLVPVRDLDFGLVAGIDELGQIRDKIERSWADYIASMPLHRRVLVQHFRIVDMALRVGGVGSVGTRCFIALLESEREDDALILQFKEAGPSALASYLLTIDLKQQAQRVVIGQRLMQATPDIFLGWHASELFGRQFYWRQLKDMKGSADVSAMDYETFGAYMTVCARSLARAHARTGDETRIHQYIGRNESFAKAIGRFGLAYANQTERDYEALVKAVRSGHVVAETGI